ncbi:hypothetical protein H5410_030134, partial [Solanum commersonii]
IKSLQILNSDQIKVDPTLLNFDVTSIIENKNIYESRDNGIELQQILFYSTQFHSGKNLESSSNHGVWKKPLEIEYYGTNCNHRYCEECIQNYIGKKINKDIHEMVSMKFPASDCNGILDIDSIMPVDFLMQVRDDIQLMEVLASPIVIDYHFMDCIGTLVVDLREYPIRACPECWRLFCVNCKCLHLGMTCENYQFSRQLNLFY